MSVSTFSCTTIWHTLVAYPYFFAISSFAWRTQTVLLILVSIWYSTRNTGKMSRRFLTGSFGVVRLGFERPCRMSPQVKQLALSHWSNLSAVDSKSFKDQGICVVKVECTTKYGVNGGTTSILLCTLRLTLTNRLSNLHRYQSAHVSLASGHLMQNLIIAYPNYYRKEIKN